MVPFPNTLLLRAQSDERLVALARTGSELAFEAIVERYRRQLVRVARQVLPDSRADDAVQQALVATWTALSRGDEVRELRPWLLRAARNAALNQLRVSGYDHDELSEASHAAPGPDEELERRLGVRRMLAGVAALPERQRDALLDIAVHGRGQDAVARELGLSEGAVRQLVHRARVHLRATATALTPMPLAGWAAATAESGAGGAAIAVAKIGAVAVLAGGAAAGPALVIQDRARQSHRQAPRAAAPRAIAAATATPAASSQVGSPPLVLTANDAPSRSPAPARRRAAGDVHRTNGAAGVPSRSGSDHPARSRSGERSGADDSGADGSGHRAGGDDPSGDDAGSSGSSGRDDRTPSGDDRSGDDHASGGDASRTRETGDTPEAAETPEPPENTAATPVTVPTTVPVDSSGKGSGRPDDDLPGS
jgi:RNA polymerase sigma factor (sigma-70 family)